MPSLSGEKLFGLVQVVKLAESSLHSSLLVSPDVPWNAKGAELLLIVEPAAGPASIVVSGAFVSTLNVRVAGVASVLPVASIARNETVWVPSLSENVFGLVQVLKFPLSSLHSSLLVSPAVPWKVKAAELVLIFEPSAGPESIVVSGGGVDGAVSASPVSRPILPAASIARKEKVWAPSAQIRRRPSGSCRS